MKTITRMFFLIIFTGMIIGCKKSNTTTEIKHAVVNWTQSKSPILSDYVSHVSYIPLETLDSCLIGEVKKIIKQNDRYYLLDNNQMLFTFDQNGLFISKIGNRGRGPGEYNDITDFDIDNESNAYLWDNSKRKMQIFSTKGKRIKEIQFDINFTNFRLISDHQILAYCNRYNKKQIAIIDMTKRKRIKLELPFPKNFEGAFNLDNKIVDRSPRHTFCLTNCDTIFSCIESKTSPMVWIDFGERKKYNKDRKKETFTIKLPNSNELKAGDISNYIDFESFGYFTFPLWIINNHAFWDKKTNNISYSASIINDLSLIPFCNPISNTPTSMISTINAFDFLNYTKSIDELEDNKTKKDKLVQDFKGNIKRLNENSNPIIIEYFVKGNSN